MKEKASCQAEKVEEEEYVIIEASTCGSSTYEAKEKKEILSLKE